MIRSVKRISYLELLGFVAMFIVTCSWNLHVGAQSSQQTTQQSKGKVDVKASWTPCPNKCLKLSNQGWCYQDMPGKPDYLIWMNFPYQGGGGECWSLDHLGEVIEYEGSRPVDNGNCPTCQRRLYVGEPTKFLKKAGLIPVHPRTIRKENETVLGRPWVKLAVQASAPDLLSWYKKQLPESGWAIVDSTRVSQDSFMVITDGVKSKWMKIAPNEAWSSEIIMMDRF